MLQQNSGSGRKESGNSGTSRESTGRPFPLVDFIARWRHGNGENRKNPETGNDEMYLDETPSSPLLPSYRNRMSSPPEEEGISRTHEEVFVPYPAPSAFLEMSEVARSRSSIADDKKATTDESVAIRQILDNHEDNEDADESDDDDDDLQSIKSYDGQRISSYDNRSLRHDPSRHEDQAENHRDPTGSEPTNNMLSNFFNDAGNFISDQRAKLHGDKSRTRLKESETEMKILRWDF